MRKIKIAQIGMNTTSHGQDIFDCLKRNSDLFEIVGYALPENEREKYPERMPAFDGFTEMTVDEILNNPEIEAVTIETEEKYLVKYATLAAQHKKHLHMEKPGGTDLRDFEKLIDILKENKTVFHTGYMYRYNPYIMDVVKRIEAGELGEIISVEAQMNCYHTESVRQWLAGYPGGMMFFLGCHLVDLILQIKGEPESIIPLNKCSGLGENLGKDFGMAVFEYENGVSFAKTSAVERGGFARRQLVISGTKGTIEMQPIEKSCGGTMLTSGYKEHFSEGWHDEAEKHITEQFDRYDTMMQSFAAMVRGEKENPWSYDYELKLYKTVLKACGCDV